MNRFLKVLSLSLIGGLVAWVIWLGTYLAHKTSAIEFDGPAGLGMALSVISGVLIFGILGIILVARKKP